MIIAEQITINDRQFTRTYSDSGFMVERDGVQYSEATDPADITREYTETDKPIEGETTDTETHQKADALDHLTGGNYE